MRHKKFIVAAAAVALVAPVGPFGQTAGATPKTAHFTFNVPAHVTINVDSSSFCDNTGPHITFNSSALFGDHLAVLELRQNVNKHETVVGAFGVTLTGGDSGLSVAKQPPLGGAGGNPFIYLRPDGGGDDIYLGRCVQDFGQGTYTGNGRFERDVQVSSFGDVSVQSLTCSNKGSSLNIGTLGGTGDVTGELILTNNYVDLNGVTPHVSQTDITASVGFSLVSGSLRKGGGRYEGTGGNPKIYAETGTGDTDSLNADGLPTDYVSDNNGQQLGRCNTLS